MFDIVYIGENEIVNMFIGCTPLLYKCNTIPTVRFIININNDMGITNI